MKLSRKWGSHGKCNGEQKELLLAERITVPWGDL